MPCSGIKMMFLASSLWLVACQPRYWSLQQSDYTSTRVIADSTGVDFAMLALVSPYKDSIQRLVGEVIGISSSEMKKKLPESALGNLLADLLLGQASAQLGSVDFAMLNYGGIRAVLPSDSIKRGDLMEILPFKNFVAVVDMDGKLVQEFLDHWASKGGTPVAGVQFLIDNGKAAGVMIQNEPLDSNRQYRVAMPDYVANGGDGCKFLQAAERIEVSPQLLFDVVLQAFQEKYQANQLIKSNEDGRVRYK